MLLLSGSLNLSGEARQSIKRDTDRDTVTVTDTDTAGDAEPLILIPAHKLALKAIVIGDLI